MTTHALAKSGNSADKQLERAKRQAILMRIVEKDGNSSFEELAQKMRENPWVNSRWPTYSAATANRDFQELMSLVKADVSELAMPYFIRQVGMMDGVMNHLYEFVNDDELGHKTRIDAANALRGYLDQSIKVFGNFAPGEMHIRKEELVFTYDDYMKVRSKVEKEKDDSDIIDGEIDG